MIVTARATESGRQKGTASGRYHVIETVEHLVVRVGVVLQLRPQMDELFQSLVVRIRAPTQLVAHKLIEGQICIDGADDRIPVLPGLPAHFVLIYGEDSITLAKSCDIEPVTTPAFAETRIVE